MFRAGSDVLPVYSIEDPVWKIKLDANERSGPVPAVVRKRIEKRWRETQLQRYPDITAGRLRKLIAAAEEMEEKQILIGGGSSELIAATCSALGGARRPIVYPWPSFSMYPVYASLADSIPVAVPLKADFSLDVETLLVTAKSCDAKLIIVSNPNNPTGGVMAADEVAFLVRESTCPVLVDEAYFEYYGETILPNLSKNRNLIVTRTFSKAMGLAAARVGYLAASKDMAEAIAKRLLPYHMNAFALIAAEEVFLSRELLLAEARKTVIRREKLGREFLAWEGMEVFPSAGNFIMIRLGPADALATHLANQGIGVRNFSKTAGLSGCIRITVGNPSENSKLVAAMKGFFGK